jgi:hypothetical protein
VNEAFVNARLDGRDAPRMRFRIPRLRQPPFGVPDPSFDVVGVVEDTVNAELADAAVPEVYVPFTVTGMADRLVVLTAMPPTNLTRSIVEQVYAIDRDQPVMDLRTLDALMQDSGCGAASTRCSARSRCRLSLAIVGVYGVVSNGVAQQTHELGVIALGANTGRIAAMVMTRGATALGHSCRPVAACLPHASWRRRSGRCRRSIPCRSRPCRCCC